MNKTGDWRGADFLATKERKENKRQSIFNAREAKRRKRRKGGLGGTVVGWRACVG